MPGHIPLLSIGLVGLAIHLTSSIWNPSCPCSGNINRLLFMDLAANRSARRVGRRSLAVAVFAIFILICTLYSLPLRSKSPSATFQSYTGPSTSLDPSSTSSRMQSPQILPLPSERSSCAVIKVSMLYGAHKFAQLEAALESHRRHSGRWGCTFESLEQDLTDRKLYSKHYFLLSTMLHELSKAPEERKQWLM